MDPTRDKPAGLSPGVKDSQVTGTVISQLRAPRASASSAVKWGRGELKCREALDAALGTRQVLDVCQQLLLCAAAQPSKDSLLGQFQELID